MVAIALLLARGAASLEDAEAAVTAARPAVRLHTEQRAQLVRLAPRLRSRVASPPRPRPDARR
jgi:hypothetical protein